jgi:hypothetical protein
MPRLDPLRLPRGLADSVLASVAPVVVRELLLCRMGTTAGEGFYHIVHRAALGGDGDNGAGSGGGVDAAVAQAPQL